MICGCGQWIVGRAQCKPGSKADTYIIYVRRSGARLGALQQGTASTYVRGSRFSTFPKGRAERGRPDADHKAEDVDMGPGIRELAIGGSGRRSKDVADNVYVRIRRTYTVRTRTSSTTVRALLGTRVAVRGKLSESEGVW